MRIIIALCTLMICEAMVNNEISAIIAIVTIILASVLEIGHILRKEK